MSINTFHGNEISCSIETTRAIHDGPIGGVVRHTYKDINGKKHFVHAVRSMGKDQGFGILNILTNAFLNSLPYKTREEAFMGLIRVEAKLQ